MIFVFGSNTHGIHGAGAAHTAMRQHGAVYGKGYGHVGNSFAIPTKGGEIHPGYGPRVGAPLPLDQIDLFVCGFLMYAASRPDLIFQVTRIGCGLAGFQDGEIAPLFWSSPPNCLFDEKWKVHFNNHINSSSKEYWGTF